MPGGSSSSQKPPTPPEPADRPHQPTTPPPEKAASKPTAYFSPRESRALAVDSGFLFRGFFNSVQYIPMLCPGLQSSGFRALACPVEPRSWPGGRADRDKARMNQLKAEGRNPPRGKGRRRARLPRPQSRRTAGRDGRHLGLWTALYEKKSQRSRFRCCCEAHVTAVVSLVRLKARLLRA